MSELVTYLLQERRRYWKQALHLQVQEKMQFNSR